MSTATPSPSGQDPWAAQLAAMTYAEKQALMERLVIDLAQHEHEFVAPEWHREILESRRKEIEDGTAVFEDWEDVKRELLGGSS